MITSYLISHVVDGVQFLFYDTVLDGKHVFTACGVGRLNGNDAALTPTGSQTLDVLCGYVENMDGPLRAIRFQEIRTLKTVELRIAKALKAADNKEVIFFVCRGHDIYDAAVVALNVHWESGAPVQ